MPRVSKELSALAIKNIKHSGGSENPERYNVGGVAGLVIQVTPKHSKSWLLRTTIAGKRQFIGLGPYPEVSLKDARDRAAEDKLKIRSGSNPALERKNAKASLILEQLRGTVFKQVVQEYLTTKLQGKTKKVQRQWQATLERYAFPVVENVLVDDIDVHHVLRILQPIWETKTETASRLRGRIESILSYAIVKGYRSSTDNPARWAGHLKEILPAPGAIQKVDHHAAVQLGEISRWYASLRALDGISARALEFLALTACRSGEIRGAVWSEIDLNSKVWIIPAARMKMSREHRVPLSNRAIEILNKIPRFPDSPYVFPSPTGKKLSDMTISKRMREMHNRDIKLGRSGWVDSQSGSHAVPHGLRSSFRQWAGEKTEYPREIIELCLAHNLMGSVERAYMRTDILEKRREIMMNWQIYMEGI